MCSGRSNIRLPWQTFDLRPQPIEVTAQEILTKDRIALRLTLTAFYHIVDVEKAAGAAVDLTKYALSSDPVRAARGDRITHAR